MFNLGTLTDRVMLFGGPYSNVQATLAIRAEARRLDIAPGNVICNGDLVAYCADPEDTVNLIRDWGVHVVLGNCEESIAALSDDCGCGFDDNTMCSLLSREWYAYTRDRVSPGNRQWMGELPRRFSFDLGNRKFAVVHGGVDNISEFIFASSDHKRQANVVQTLGVDCVIGGHCGIPFGNRLPNTGDHSDQTSARYWLNTGVIGMPANDGTCDGWYMLLNERDGEVTCQWNRLSFDSESAVRSMQRVGLGKDYSQSLISGMWPSQDVLPDLEKSRQGQPIDLAPMRLT